MSSPPNISLSRRLFYSHLTCSLLVAAAVAVYLLFTVQRSLLDTARTELEKSALGLAAAVALVDVNTQTGMAQCKSALEQFAASHAEITQITLLQQARQSAQKPLQLLDVSRRGSLNAMTLRTALPIGEAGLLLQISATALDVQEKIRVIRTYALLGFIGAVLLSLLFSRWLAGMTKSLVDRYIESFKQIASGQLDAKINHSGNDEFGKLAAAFNQMSEKLRRTLTERDQSLRELGVARDRLEGNVRERTAELNRINEMLRHEHEQRALLEANLAQAAATDAMTGLLNRRAMMEVLDQMGQHNAKHGKSSSLVTLDIDHFKQINDRFGHAVGDRVLKDLAAVLRTETGSDEVAARWGGEEFLLLWPDQSLQAGEQRCNRLREKLASQIQVGPQFRFGVSIGLAQWQSGEMLDLAIGRSDKALYAAKAGGRNRVCVG